MSDKNKSSVSICERNANNKTSMNQFLTPKKREIRNKSIIKNYSKYSNGSMGGKHKYSPEEGVGSVLERKCLIRKHLSELGLKTNGNLLEILEWKIWVMGHPCKENSICSNA